MIKEAIDILQGLFPDKEIIPKAKSSYSMYISGKEDFIIGVDHSEDDKIYFCPYKLQTPKEKRSV